MPIKSRRFLNDCHETVSRLAIGAPFADKANTLRSIDFDIDEEHSGTAQTAEPF